MEGVRLNALDLVDQTNEVLRLMDDDRAVRIFASIFDDMTWEHVAELEQISVEEAQRIYEQACDELRAALEASSVPMGNPDKETKA